MIMMIIKVIVASRQEEGTKKEEGKELGVERT